MYYILASINSLFFFTLDFAKCEYLFEVFAYFNILIFLKHADKVDPLYQKPIRGL